MNARSAPARFRQGSGRLCLDFARTLRYRGTPSTTEELGGPEALAAWVAQCGPYGPSGSSGGGRVLGLPSEEDVRAARALREAAYALVTAALGPEGPGAVSTAARGRLNRAA